MAGSIYIPIPFKTVMHPQPPPTSPFFQQMMGIAHEQMKLQKNHSETKPGVVPDAVMQSVNHPVRPRSISDTVIPTQYVKQRQAFSD